MSRTSLLLVWQAASVIAQDLASFWQLLKDGRSGISEFPESRQHDVAEFLRLSGVQTKVSQQDYLHAAFLPNIDYFDHDFFGISKQEANMMSPEQRLFLQTAWHALEEAGYGGDSIRGSNTGVFAGFSNDFGESYRRLVDTLAPDAPEISVVGNINSVIACRLAYLLDLKGPTMLVDTACSSSLVSLHLASRSLRSGECDMALVGTVNINLVPLLLESNTGVGVKDIKDNFAHDHHTKAFDESSDGMSIGEGVLVFALKRLSQALDDGDQVHAVIRGSAINQDGQSIGLTAPNSAAQADLLKAAWRDAAVTAHDISYIEAHGTGTKLGDPVEISGLQQAFQQATSRKQFCGVGSVKSNIGHLDNAAGLAGLAKVVLSMKHAKLPASLNFRLPNRQISFERSPVYVNDRLNDWSPTNEQHQANRKSSQQKLIAGVSSYGLSGTNCHVVLQSAKPVQAKRTSGSDKQSWLLPISAKTENALKRLARDYLELLHTDHSLRLEDISYTATTGRLHHNKRVAFVFTTANELIERLVEFVSDKESGVKNASEKDFSNKDTGKRDSAIFISDDRRLKEETRTELTTKANQLLKSEANFRTQETKRDTVLRTLASLYCEGANPSWGDWFEGWNVQRISLPLYPFAQERCWVESSSAGETLAANRNGGSGLSHPLLSQVSDSQDLSIYRVTLSADSHWVLSDHKVEGAYVLPGTCYVEMMLAVAARLAGQDSSKVSFESIQFLNPFIVQEHQQKELSLQVVKSSDGYDLKISSLGSDDNWQTHAIAKLGYATQSTELDEQPESVDLQQLIESLSVPLELTSQDDLERGLEIGDRWYRSLKQSWCNPQQTIFLAELCIPPQYAQEVKDYHYHPALLDTAINAANHIGGNGELYLPFFYKALNVYRDLPGDFFVHLERTSEAEGEIVTFRVQLIDKGGNVCASVEQYGIKNATQFASLNHSTTDEVNAFHLSLVNDILVDDNLVKDSLVNYSTVNDSTVNNSLLINAQDNTSAENNAGHSSKGSEQEQPILFIHSGTKEQLNLLETLSQKGLAVIEVRLDDGNDKDVLGQLADSSVHFSCIVYAAAWQYRLHDEKNLALHQLMRSVKHLVNLKLACSGNFFVLTHKGFGGDSDPLQASIASFARVISLENPQLSLLCLDIDPSKTEVLLNNLLDEKAMSTGQTRIFNEAGYQRESIELVTIPQSSQSLVLKDKGVYFISGGCGALGLELALELAELAESLAVTIKIVLTTTSELPDRAEWQTLIASKQTPQKLLNRLLKLKKLSEYSAEIDCVLVDVSDAKQTDNVLEKLRSKGAQINGVIHAAGRAGDGFILNKSSEELQSVLSPKVQGGWNLHQLTKNDPLDFFVMYSSIAGVCHEAGQSDYTAANRFMDVLAKMRRNQGLPALSVAWPAWRETGIAVEYGAVNEDEIFQPINTRQALKALTNAISAGADIPSSIVLSNLNPNATVKDFEALNLACGDEITAILRLQEDNQKDASRDFNNTGKSLKQADLIGISEPDQYDILVANVWSQVLGRAELHIDDSFNDLGGNSILTTQKYQAFEGLHPGVIDMADLFTHTTLREQASVFRKNLEPVVADSQSVDLGTSDNILVEQALEEQLAKLAAGEISVEEIQGLI